MATMYIEDKEDGAIGIGAMIVFIALILVAAVASAVIIQTGEKLQQNAQQTGSDTQREISGKISINTMIVYSDTQYMLYFEAAPGSGVLEPTEVNYQLTCENSGYKYESANFALLTLTDGSSAGGSIEPAKQYRIIITSTDCHALGIGINDEATMWIHVNGGGSTYEKLYISDTAHGTPIV